MSDNRIRSRIRSVREERGAVLVEAALAIPILLLVIFGAIEAGFAWEAKSSGTSAVRTGLIRASSLGDKAETDLRTLQSVLGEIGADKVDDIEWIIVFEADVADAQARIDDCETSLAAGGIANECVVYPNSVLDGIVDGTITLDDFDNGSNDGAGGYTCDTTKLDADWCAPSRLESGDTQVGVAVKFGHDWYTGIFPGDGVTLEDFAVSAIFAES